jgi:hypothetical protein
MYMNAHPFHTPMIAMYKKYDDVLIGSPLLFIRSTALVKSVRIKQDIDQESLAFLRGAAHVKSIRDRTECRSKAPCFLHALVR